MHRSKEFSSCIFIDADGVLAFEFLVEDVMFTERMRGEITGIVEFEGHPEFCDDHHIYFWRKE